MTSTSRALAFTGITVLVCLSGPRAVLAEKVVRRGDVIEVKGRFCKFDLAKQDGIRKGGKATLHRDGAAANPIGEIEVTTVKDEYSVGKVEGAVPRVGDIVEIKIRIRSNTSGTKSASPKSSGDRPLLRMRRSCSATGVVSIPKAR